MLEHDRAATAATGDRRPVERPPARPAAPGLSRRAWLWWIPVVVGLSLPVIGFTRHPQWARVHLVPFSDPEDKLRDEVVNIGMYVPFGYLYARPRRFPRAVVGALAWALVVAAGAEATQLFSVRRNPSATDASMAVVGSALGALLARVSDGL